MTALLRGFALHSVNIFPRSRSEPVGPFSDLSAEGFRGVTVALVFYFLCGFFIRSVFWSKSSFTML